MAFIVTNLRLSQNFLNQLTVKPSMPGALLPFIFLNSAWLEFEFGLSLAISSFWLSLSKRYYDNCSTIIWKYPKHLNDCTDYGWAERFYFFIELSVSNLIWTFQEVVQNFSYTGKCRHERCRFLNSLPTLLLRADIALKWKKRKDLVSHGEREGD